LAFLRLLLLLFIFFTYPSYAQWYILLPKGKRPPQKKGAPIPSLKKKISPKPYTVEVPKVIAPRFALYTPSLKEITKEDLLGKPLVILFVKDLFEPKVEELAEGFERLSSKEKVNFIVISINDADFISAKEFKNLLGLKKVLVSADSYTFLQFKKNLKDLNPPSLVIVDEYGFIRYFSPEISSSSTKTLKELSQILRTLKGKAS